jgi:hypothetical protein
MNVAHIDIGTDFSRYLGPRLKRDGQNSGEEFREKILEPAFIKYDMVVIHIDSVATISASFFEEAFGGLVRKFGREKVEGKVEFKATKRAYLIPKLKAWIADADPSME